MNVVDSSGWLEYLADGPNAGFFAAAVEDTSDVESHLPMADSVILATARQCEATLWTQDADFEDLQGVRYVARIP